MQGYLPAFSAALDQVRGNEESAKIAEANKEREATFSSLRDALKAYRTTKEANEKTAYSALFLLISEYKGIEDDSYEAKTNRLSTLVERLRSQAYQHHVNELTLGKFVTRLADANTFFNQLFAKRSFQISQKPTINVKEQRAKILEVYRKAVTYVAAIADVRDDSFYKDTLVIINNSRKYFSDTLLARRSKKKTSKEEVKKEENSTEVSHL